MRDDIRRALQRLRYELAQGCGPDADRALDIVENELTTAYAALPRTVGEDAPQRATLGERIAVMDAAIVQRGLRIEQLEKLAPPTRPVPGLRVATAPEPNTGEAPDCSVEYTPHPLGSNPGECVICRTAVKFGFAAPNPEPESTSGPELSVPSGTVQPVTAPPAKAPRRDGHVAIAHGRDCRDRESGRHCMFCDGGLFGCSVCGSFEGATTDMCPGERMTPEQRTDPNGSRRAQAGRAGGAELQGGGAVLGDDGGGGRTGGRVLAGGEGRGGCLTR